MKHAGLLTVAAGALLALTASGLASAQPYDHRGPPDGYHRDWGRGGDRGPERSDGWNLDRRIEWLQQRIDHGRDDGSLDRREAWRVQSRLDEIRQEERRLRRHHGGGLGDDDRDALNRRLDRLNDQIRWLRHNDERRPW